MDRTYFQYTFSTLVKSPTMKKAGGLFQGDHARSSRSTQLYTTGISFV